LRSQIRPATIAPFLVGGESVKTVIYPGTFNPITNGHTDLVNRALNLFDHVILAIGTSAQKSGSDQLLDRIRLCEQVLAPFGSRVTVERFTGLLVDYANTTGTRFILRGLRTMADFEYEFQMAEMNTELEPSIEYVFLLPSKSCSFISSTLVREIASLGGNVSKFVDPIVAEALRVDRANKRPKS
jgi:pantetheine-phosphate adenylyltransferase